MMGSFSVRSSTSVDDADMQHRQEISKQKDEEIEGGDPAARMGGAGRRRSSIDPTLMFIYQYQTDGWGTLTDIRNRLIKRMQT